VRQLPALHQALYCMSVMRISADRPNSVLQCGCDAVNLVPGLVNVVGGHAAWLGGHSCQGCHLPHSMTMPLCPIISLQSHPANKAGGVLHGGAAPYKQAPHTPTSDALIPASVTSSADGAAVFTTTPTGEVDDAHTNLTDRDQQRAADTALTAPEQSKRRLLSVPPVALAPAGESTAAVPAGNADGHAHGYVFRPQQLPLLQSREAARGPFNALYGCLMWCLAGLGLAIVMIFELAGDWMEGKLSGVTRLEQLLLVQLLLLLLLLALRYKPQTTCTSPTPPSWAAITAAAATAAGPAVPKARRGRQAPKPPGCGPCGSG